MKMKLKNLLPLALIINLIGCQQVPNERAATTPTITDTKDEMSSKEREIVKDMQWVIDANAIADAQKSLSADTKPELIAFSGRGLSFPGLSLSQYEDIKDKVIYSTAKGSGDIIYGGRHKNLRKQLRKYSREYNQTIYNSVMKRR